MKLLAAAALLAIAVFQFFVYPGHTYLRGDTQLFVPGMEHVLHPGLLTRDLVATHPEFTYTAFDEITLLIARAPHCDLRRSLDIQQLLFRFAAVVGLFLLARAAGVRRWRAVLIAGVVGFGAYLYGPQVSALGSEPSAPLFALCAVLLACGVLASGRPLLAGLVGGIALLYDLRVAAAFWIVMICGSFRSRLFRATLPALAVFALLLANLAQLQPDIPEPHGVFEALPPAMEHIQRFRMPQLWVSNWPIWSWLLYCALAFAAWAFRETSRLLAALSLCGVVSIPASYLLLAGLHWRLAPQIQLTYWLTFLVLFTLLNIGVTADRRNSRAGWAVFAICACAAIASNRRPPRPQPVQRLSEWAASSTWGGSMFLFPDAGASNYPGAFRGLAERAVWTDWESGSQSVFFDSFADEWYRRWMDTMAGGYSSQRLQAETMLPVDYIVLRREHALGSTPVFADDNFVVYDAHSLNLR